MVVVSQNVFAVCKVRPQKLVCFVIRFLVRYQETKLTWNKRKKLQISFHGKRPENWNTDEWNKQKTIIQ